MKNFLKRYGVSLLALLLFLYGVGISGLHVYKTKLHPDVVVTPGEEQAERPFMVGNKEKKYSVEKMGIETSNLTDNNVDGDDGLLIVPNDYENIFELYGLPRLERMEITEAAELVDSMQVMKKIRNLGIKASDYWTPELKYKTIYADVMERMDSRDYSKLIEFDGTKISEINGFIADKKNVYVKLTAREIEWDMTLLVPSDVAIDALGVDFYSDKDIGKLIHLVDKENVSLNNFNIQNLQYEFGLFILGGHGISLRNSTFNNAYGKAIVVMGIDDYIEMTGNTVESSGHGAIIMNGNISKVVLKDNKLLHTRGSDNFSASIVLSSVEMANLNTCFNPYIESSIADHLNAPHDCVVIGNQIIDGNSSGIYSDGSYGNYFINNTLYLNDKEGICLDQGTALCYVAGNVFDGNGSRRKMSVDELMADFVGEFGLAADGTSAAKLPGISLDNAGYNIIYNNVVKNNSGSGIKMVRSSARNIIMNNVIMNNNQGENQVFHFFGVELGSNLKPDYATTSIDFTACFENIICRNVIDGEHYSGVYLAPECYTNDIFDNVILRSTYFSIESHSDKYNASANNIADTNSSGIDLSGLTNGVIMLPGIE